MSTITQNNRQPSADKPTPPVTLEQQRAQFAWACAKEGTALIFNKLMGYLKTKGLEVIKAKGEKFDTDFHEAVAQFPVPEEDKKGLVYDVVQTGYTLSGKVITWVAAPAADDTLLADSRTLE